MKEFENFLEQAVADLDHYGFIVLKDTVEHVTLVYFLATTFA